MVVFSGVFSVREDVNSFAEMITRKPAKSRTIDAVKIRLNIFLPLYLSLLQSKIDFNMNLIQSNKLTYFI